MKLIFELSGENETLPAAELACIGTLLDQRRQVAVAECPDKYAAKRLSMTHVVLEYLGECRPDFSSFSALLDHLSLVSDRPFSARVRKVFAGDKRLIEKCSQQDFERLIGTKIDGQVNLSAPETEFRAILSEDRCYFGRVLFAIDRGSYDKRNPGSRNFFHPGVMMPRMARALVNLSCVEKGGRLLDPFCGTGGILIEAALVGTDVTGSDFDPFMVTGSKQNVEPATLLISDAVMLPFSDASFDAVVTDFPYGQSVSIWREGSMDCLYDHALREIQRVLKKKHRAVVVTHQDILAIAKDYFTVIQTHQQRVHKSLTRKILVLEK